MMRIDKESKELYLMYSIDQSSFSKESLKEASKGKSIEE